MQHAMHALQAHPAVALSLAVDARNHAARRLYTSLGFAEIDSNEVLLYVF